MINRAEMLLLAVCVFVGCNAYSAPDDRPADPVEPSVGQKQVTFYVAGMNERLKIL